MILRRTARPKAGSHSARLWGLRNNHLNMLLDSENSSSLSPVLTVSLKGYLSASGPTLSEAYIPSNNEKDADTPNTSYEDVSGEEANEGSES